MYMGLFGNKEKKLAKKKEKEHCLPYNYFTDSKQYSFHQLKTIVIKTS